ncbi:MAG: shikimate kinase [Candidatus Omnitrophota bacterium]
MKNIILTGFMGTGKTVIGKILAEKLKRQRLCLDDMIQWKTGKPIAEIFKDNGEGYFRKIESQMVAAAAKDKNVIIDAGGGAIINEDNLKRLKERGVIFCLTASVDAIIQRTSRTNDRPLLNVTDPKAKIEQLLNEREKFYKRADHILDTTNLTPEEAAQKIIEYMASLEKVL